MTATSRLRVEPVDGAAALFTGPFVEYLVALHDGLHARALALRARRAEMLADALHRGRPPRPFPASEATTGAWSVPPVPDELRRPGIDSRPRARFAGGRRTSARTAT